jgi:hypothetical protein
MMQANINPALPREEWNLEALCAKVKQYVPESQLLHPTCLNFGVQSVFFINYSCKYFLILTM